MFGDEYKIKTMKLQEKKSFQNPVSMTQEEINEVKQGNKKIINTINTRIKKSFPENLKKKSGSSKKAIEKSSPFHITKNEMLALKRTGKLPVAVNKKFMSKTNINSIKHVMQKKSPKSYPTIPMS